MRSLLALLVLSCAGPAARPGAGPPRAEAGAIHTSQIGFQPGQQKLVTVSGTPAPPGFTVIAADGGEVFSAPLRPLGVDPDSGDAVARGDFSALRAPGTYRVHAPGRIGSSPFRIAEDAHVEVARLAARWFFLQRSGADKDDPVTGLRHRADHVQPARPRTPAVAATNLEVSGGWWDAGDFGRYVPPAATSVMVLLHAYRFHPALFADGALRIPESGNGVPDLLDEVRWELRWLLKMQRADGAVHHKVATKAYPSPPPDRDLQPLYLYEVTSQATAQFCGVMAEASLALRPIDPAFADGLLAAARRAWAWLSRHPGQVPPGGFRNPDDPNGGDYRVTGDEAEQRAWAAAALLHGSASDSPDPDLAQAFARSWARRDRDRVYSVGWRSGWVFAMAAYLHSPGADLALKEEVRQVFVEHARRILLLTAATGYHVALHGAKGEFGYDWGSVGRALDFGVYLLLAHEVQPDPALVDGAAAQLSWVLGHNPLGRCFLTGAGHVPVRHPHHRPSSYIGHALPGAVGEGPNAMNIGGDPVLARLFAAGLPPARRYADDDGSWATNEPTIYYNASFVALAAWFTRPVARPSPPVP